MMRCSLLYWPKRQGPLWAGMKKAVRAGSTPGSWIFFRKLPVVQIMGKHSREEVYFLPHSRSSSSCMGRTSASMPQAREAAASR